MFDGYIFKISCYIKKALAMILRNIMCYRTMQPLYLPKFFSGTNMLQK